MHDGQVRMIQFYHLDYGNSDEEVEKDLNIMMVRDGSRVVGLRI